MTKEQLINILENDPRCKLTGKSAVVTFYDSPFDNVYYGEDEAIHFVMDGEEAAIPVEEYNQLNLEPIQLNSLAMIKSISLTMYLANDLVEGGYCYVMPSNDAEEKINFSASLFEQFPGEPENDAGDDGEDGEDGGNGGIS